jgi:hypothetical protein
VVKRPSVLLLTDETCWFLAADFDGDHWQDDATAFTCTAKLMGMILFRLKDKYQ